MNPGDLVHIPSDVLLVEHDCYASEEIFKYIDNYVITEKPELVVLIGTSIVLGYSKVVFMGKVWLVLSSMVFAPKEGEQDVGGVGASNLV